MSFSTGFRKCKKCGKTLFGLFDGELCDECEKAEQEPIEKITLWGGEQFVSIETYQQVCKERDIAIEQLHELGYELGQKIEPRDDVVSRQAVLIGTDGMFCEEWVKTLFKTMVEQLPSVRPQEQTGHWVEDKTTYAGTGMGNYKCSVCDRINGSWIKDMPSVYPNFCWWCGARMESEE